MPGGYVWSSDPRLTLPALQRLTEAQIRQVLADIPCPARVVFADPAQAYMPDALRRERAALLPRGQLIVLPGGGHHLHMENPHAVAEVLRDLFPA